VRQARVEAARRHPSWQEIEAVDLVRRRPYWVSATSDELFTEGERSRSRRYGVAGRAWALTHLGLAARGEESDACFKGIGKGV
jgi:hypothetical protein